MAIVQISQIKQRTGNLVDLPQLTEAEFGWASDEKRLFIGKETPNENVEVLTSYSRIDFNQIGGSVGNLNISPVPLNGQVLAYDGMNWVNRGKGADGLITLGEVSNVKIDGGAIGYVLQTDGLGNLSWAPRGVLFTEILDLSPDSGNVLGYGANVVIMQVANTTPYTNGVAVTITGVEGNANANVNSQVFFLKLDVDYPTSGNVVLFTTQDLDPSNVLVDADLEYDNPPNAIATSLTGGVGGSANAGGSAGSVQYNNNNLLAGDANFNWDFNNRILTVAGNTDVGNLNATGTVISSRLISNVATGTAPLTVTSTTVVANLNADRVDGFDTSVSSTANTIVVRNANGNIAANNISGTLSTAAQPNVTSLGNATQVTIAGNLNPNANITYDLGNTTSRWRDLYLAGNTIFIGTQTISANTTSISLSGNVSAENIGGTLTTAAQTNITSVGTLTNLAVNGNITVTTGIITGNAHGISSINASNISSGVLSAARLSGVYGISITGAAATVTAAAQPSITSLGTLTALTVAGNTDVGNLNATGTVISSRLISNVATGTAPLTVTSTTKVANLNVDLLDGYNSSINTDANTVVVRDANGNVSANSFIGDGSSLSSITGANVTGQVLFAAVANSVALANVAGIGNIASINLTGDSSKVLLGSGAFGDVVIPIPTIVQNGSSNVIVNSNGPIVMSASGQSNVVSVTSAGAAINGNLSISANLVTGNTSTTNITSSGAANIVALNVSANTSLNNVSITGNVAASNITAVNIVSTGNISGNVAGFAVGYRDIPQIFLNSNTTIQLSDAGKHYYSNGSSNYTVTIANSAVANFAIGAVINLINRSTGNITIAQGSGVSLYSAGSDTPSNRTLISYGMATIQKVENNVWIVVGIGVV
jgi:hypothetical protein